MRKILKIKKFIDHLLLNFHSHVGRDGFEIRENGQFILYIMGPTDRPEKIFGNFTIDSNNLNVELVSIQKSYIMTILSCNENLLVISK